MKNVTFLFLLLVLLLGCNTEDNFDTNTKYIVDVAFKDDSGILNCSMKTIWNNTSDVAISEIPFHFQSDSLNSLIKLVKLNDKEANIRYTTKDIDGFDGFAVIPNKPIKAGKLTSIHLEFETQERSIGEYQNGKINDFTYFFSDDFPRIAFFEHGDFIFNYQVHANYQVNISYPSKYKIACTGLISNKNENDQETIVTTKANDVPNYGILFFKNVHIEERKTNNNVLIRSIFTEEDKKWGMNILSYAEDIVQFYGDTLGVYPQPVLNIIPGYNKPYGGWPVSPNIVGVHRGIDAMKNKAETHAKWITAHEIGHQYWGFNYVLDPIDYPQWFGIGMGILTDRLYTLERNLDMNHDDYFSSSYFQGVKRGYNTTIMQKVEDLNDQGFDWNNIIKHDKAYLVLRMLAYEIGEDTFFKIFKHCLNNYKGVNVTLDMFKADCEQISGKNLDLFFNTWFYSNDHLEYKVASVETNTKNDAFHNTIIISKVGNAGTRHLEVQLLLENNKTINRVVNGYSPSNQIELITRFPIVSISLDPKHQFPLINNKTWIAKTTN